MYFTCVNGPACTLFTGQPVYAARASPSVMARSWPTARIPEPVLTARTGPSRAHGLALARRITDQHSNFRCTVIPFSREHQGPLLSLVYFINNNPYEQKNHVYFHAACSKFIFPLGFYGEFSWKIFSRGVG